MCFSSGDDSSYMEQAKCCNAIHRNSVSQIAIVKKGILHFIFIVSYLNYTQQEDKEEIYIKKVQRNRSVPAKLTCQRLTSANCFKVSKVVKLLLNHKHCYFIHTSFSSILFLSLHLTNTAYISFFFLKHKSLVIFYNPPPTARIKEYYFFSLHNENKVKPIFSNGDSVSCAFAKL